MQSEQISIFDNVKTDRDYRSTTGLSLTEFKELSSLFSCYYRPSILVGFPAGFGHNSIFQNPSEALFFLLYHHKVAVTYDVLALSFGMGRATAHTAIKALKPILKLVLGEQKSLPARLFSTAQDLEAYFSSVGDLMLDATETPTQRPNNEQEQADRYSKKNISTVSRIPL
jgi:hypothetical protein